MYMINYLTTKEEKNELLKTFQHLDTNGDGILTKDELLFAYRNILGPHRAEEEVARIMDAVDKDASGSIDYTGG
jgi:calcium-dependent protein kinase